MHTLDQALTNILAALTPITETETVPLAEGFHRVLAQSAPALVDVPPADVSAMDGYAFNFADIELVKTQGLNISQRIPAGSAQQPLAVNTAARIFTGAMIPDNADTVVIQEDCETIDDKIKIIDSVSFGDNIRRRGQDSKAGNILLESGQRLRPQDLGLLASVGTSQVAVFRKLKVAILSSGDELVEPGENLTPGKIYNSNRYLLHGLLNSIGVDIVDCGLVQDSLQETKDALLEAATTADCIITTGGVSVGEEDHLKGAVEALGQLNLWKMAIKPGKPFAFGNIDHKPFFGLPGNPVAVFVTFLLVMRPALLKLQGVDPLPQIISQRFPANFSIEDSGSRQEYLRVRIVNGKVERYRTQDSSVLSSTSWAQALAVIPPRISVNVGDLVEVIPLANFQI